MEPITAPAPPLTVRTALARVAATAVQASAAVVVAVGTLVLADAATEAAVIAAVLGSGLVPVATFVHRLAGVWLAERNG